MRVGLRLARGDHEPLAVEVSRDLDDGVHECPSNACTPRRLLHREEGQPGDIALPVNCRKNMNGGNAEYAPAARAHEQHGRTARVESDETRPQVCRRRGMTDLRQQPSDVFRVLRHAPTDLRLHVTDAPARALRIRVHACVDGLRDQSELDRRGTAQI